MIAEYSASRTALLRSLLAWGPNARKRYVKKGAGYARYMPHRCWSKKASPTNLSSSKKRTKKLAKGAQMWTPPNRRTNSHKYLWRTHRPFTFAECFVFQYTYMAAQSFTHRMRTFYGHFPLICYTIVIIVRVRVSGADLRGLAAAARPPVGSIECEQHPQ